MDSEFSSFDPSETLSCPGYMSDEVCPIKFRCYSFEGEGVCHCQKAIMQSDEHCGTRTHVFPFAVTMVILFLELRAAHRALVAVLDPCRRSRQQQASVPIIEAATGTSTTVEFSISRYSTAAAHFLFLHICFQMVFFMVHFVQLWNASTDRWDEEWQTGGMKLVFCMLTTCIAFAFHFCALRALELIQQLGVIEARNRSCWLNRKLLSWATIYNAAIAILLFVTTSRPGFYLLTLGVQAFLTACVVLKTGKTVRNHFAASREDRLVETGIVVLVDKICWFVDRMVIFTCLQLLLGAIFFFLDVLAPSTSYLTGILINISIACRAFVVYGCYTAMLDLLETPEGGGRDAEDMRFHIYSTPPFLRRLHGHLAPGGSPVSSFAQADDRLVRSQLFRARSCPWAPGTRELWYIDEKGESQLVGRTSGKASGESKVASSLPRPSAGPPSSSKVSERGSTISKEGGRAPLPLLRSIFAGQMPALLSRAVLSNRVARVHTCESSSSFELFRVAASSKIAAINNCDETDASSMNENPVPDDKLENGGGSEGVSMRHL
mmetsp:Transcript_50241/g.86426  ORF Transcript_50241/g.86426 Transcript_50241/m.86426 type:complete len:549 (-) Transcript_50241:257-1903(-)